MQPDEDQQWEQPDQMIDGEAPQPPPMAPETMSWQASEFVQHEKDGLWFIAVGGAAFVLLLVNFLLIQSWTFGALTVVMAIGVIVLARRPPRILNYSLSTSTIQIDDKTLNLHDFRAFGVLQEEALYSIQLIPKKRLMPAINVFFPPEYGEDIVDMFATTLPMEHIQHGLIDTLAQKIRF